MRDDQLQMYFERYELYSAHINDLLERGIETEYAQHKLLKTVGGMNSLVNAFFHDVAKDYNVKLESKVNQ